MIVSFSSLSTVVLVHNLLTLVKTQCDYAIVNASALSHSSLFIFTRKMFPVEISNIHSKNLILIPAEILRIEARREMVWQMIFLAFETDEA